jgi:hypothetical protein
MKSQAFLRGNFLPIISTYMALADIRSLEKVLNSKNFSKVNFINADLY